MPSKVSPVQLAVPTTYQKVRVGETEIFFREAGQRDRPTILLLHGFPSSSHMFRDLIPTLAAHYHVVAPDLPGFGFTLRGARHAKLTFDALADSIAGFVETLKLDRYVIYVFDYGAPVGLRLATRNPDRVLALISQNGNAYLEGLSEGWNPIQAYWKNPSEENRNALRGFLSAETTQWQYTHGVPDPTRIAPESYTLDSLLMARPGNDEIQLDLFLDYASNVTLYPTFQKYFRDRQPPLLAVWGKNDPFFLPQGAAAFKRDIPDAEVHLLDTGHFALESHHDEIGSLILDFLERRLGRGKTVRGSTQTSNDRSISMSNENRTPEETNKVHLVSDFYERLGKGDVPGVLALLDPQVKWTEAERFPYYTGTWVGPDAVLNNLLKRLSADWTDFAAIPKDYLIEGSRIVSFGTYSGRYKKTGKTMRSDFAHVWTVEGDKITSFLMYTDTAKILEALVG